MIRPRRKKTAMWELAGRGFGSGVRTLLYPAEPAGFTDVVSMTITDKEPPLSRRGSRLAILVHQGSDPTQPYPTLVIRDRAPRFSTALRLGVRYDVVRPLVRMVTLWDQPPLIRWILPGSPPVWPRPRGESCPGGAVQPPAASGPGPVPSPEGPLPHDGRDEEAEPPRRRGFVRTDQVQLNAHDKI